ncbi:MAG: hypothetical protein HZB52_14830 [Chloroflexi bacterium]|nr:hypothetical protein [Chloroflexota bacterium]
MIRKITVAIPVIAATLACSLNLSPAPAAVSAPLNTQAATATSAPPITFTPSPTFTPFVFVNTPTPNYDHYQAGTLKSVIQLNQKTVAAQNNGLYLPENPPALKVKLKYSGESRKMPFARSLFLSVWMNTFGIDRNLRQALADELLFAEDATEFWMMTKDKVIPRLQKGDEVSLYVVWIGALIEADKIDWVFMVNEIEK